MNFDICFSPALYPYYMQKNDTVVVVDIFRASTTMCAILFNDASAVIPVASVEEAFKYKKDGFLVGGERNARKIDFADFGNSPFDYTREVVENREIVFTTTNGTQAIEAALGAKTVLVGAFSNIDAVAEKCLKTGNRVVVLCAGWKNRPNIEDTLFGGALAEKLTQKTGSNFNSDSVRMAADMWRSAKADPVKFVKPSEHYKRLIDNDAEGDIAFCFRENSLPIVPVYNKNDKKLVIWQPAV